MRDYVIGLREKLVPAVKNLTAPGNPERFADPGDVEEPADGRQSPPLRSERVAG